MIQMMRWYGPTDPVSLSDIRQAGCSGVVTALHHIPVGEIWEKDEINQRKSEIEAVGMEWTVVESLPVHEAIKMRKGDFVRFIENYKQSLVNLSECGVKVVTYNFMPVLDWVRTNVSYALPSGSKALYFERSAFVAFDLFLLKRPNAELDYSKEEVSRAKTRFDAMDNDERQRLFATALLGLPGSDVPFTAEQVLGLLKQYDRIDARTLKENLYSFLRAVVPVAESVGIKMAIHPDDPPYPILGLPRIVSSEKDLEDIINACPSLSNGLCVCTGSLGVRFDNNIISILKKFGSRVHFLHLRNTRRDADGNFLEADHLDGDTDMYSVVHEIVLIEKETRVAIPMRPDHGHQMLDDLKKVTYPGYSAIGRLKGLAELRGLEIGISRSLDSFPAQQSNRFRDDG